MSTNDIDEVTRILTEFAATKFAAEVLAVKGPVHEGSGYIWRIVSNRYKEVTVVMKTSKSLFGKPAVSGIEVYGLGEAKVSKPDLKALQDYLATAELTGVR